MKTIAALIVTYNAERYIRGCLESVKGWVDEIIVVDMFSTDRTIEIVRKYTDKIIQDKEKNHEARANIGIENATSDWILKINATERIPKLLRDEITQTINKENEFVGYYVPRKNYIYGIFMEERPGTLYLFKRGVGKYPTICGHEKIDLKGKVGFLKNFKIHWASSISIEDGVEKINRYTSNDSKAVFAGNPCAFFWKHPVKKANLFNMIYRPIVGFFVSYIFAKGYRYRMHGFVLAVMCAINHFLEIAKLWELQYKKKHNIKDELVPWD